MEAYPIRLPGYRLKILDGNAIAASEHRLKPLRNCNSAPLPGQSLVVLDPPLMLLIDVPCVDADAQERSLVDKVLATIEEDDVWVANRNFCTLNFLIDIVARKHYFIIREHQCFPWCDAFEFRHIGSVEGGTVFEQTVKVSDDEGYLSNIRRLKVILDETIRDRNSEISILINLSVAVANALVVAQIYRKRWKVETLF